MVLKLTISRIENENLRTRVFFLSNAQGGELPYYSAGAHIDVQLEGIGSRSYSLIDFKASSGAPLEYCIAVQREDNGDGGSRAMHLLSEGDVISAGRPVNDFELNPSSHSATILLAGGIGVTPLTSMATQLLSTGSPFQFHYSARNSESMAFASQLSDRFPDQLSLYLDNRNPLVLHDLFVNTASDTSVYLCGPRGMIHAAREAAMNAGINTDNIYIELFSNADEAADDTEFEVELQSSGQVFSIPPGRTIIEVLEEADIDLMFDCQRGDCGICQTDVISGTPDHRDVVLTKDQRASGKVMQICVSRSKSPRLVLDL